jgi:hypothetical protein
VLDPDKSLANAVKQIRSCLAVEEAEVPSLNTGGYAKARKRLPEKILKWLFEHTGETLTAEAGVEQRWQGRCVKVLDGSTVVMADTAANQKEYPQHKNQQPGCGFPIAKLVVMFSLTTAAAMGVRIAALNTFEALPPTLQVREVHFCVERPGWRTKSVTVVTQYCSVKPENLTVKMK